MKGFPLLITVFTNLNSVDNFSLLEWDLLVRQARAAGVLPRLGYLLDQQGCLLRVPSSPLVHIQSAQNYAEKFKLTLFWEYQCVEESLKTLNIPFIALKGAAYVICGLNAGKGRIFTDIDLLVSEKDIDSVESALMLSGWKPGQLDAYDRRYYRKWMHEIPPLNHVRRGSSIDLHHNILPKTNATCPNAEKLIANKVATANNHAFVFSPEDMVLHSATHLFHEGEFDNGFRDLSDLDQLLKEFSSQDKFWDNLLQRASELNQKKPLYYALRYTQKVLQTSIPDYVISVTEQWFPRKAQAKIMDFMFLRALMPNHPSCEDLWTGFACWLLYIRSHWLKMPIHLLIPHLCRKSWLRLTGQKDH